MQPTKEQATQNIFDNLPHVVEPQKYFQSRLDAIKAKCEVVNIVHTKMNELENTVKDYVNTFLNCKVANATGGFFHKFEKGFPKLPTWGENSNRMNFYIHKSMSSIILKGSATVYYDTVDYRGNSTNAHINFEVNMYLGDFDGSGNLTKVYDDRKPYPMYNFEQVKAQLIRIDQLKRFLSSQESVQGCSYMFQNML
jgi:hypothetical protein